MSEAAAPSLIGHERVRTMLDTFVSSGSVPHALLFAGPASVGKRTIALAFLKKLHIASAKNSDEKRIDALLPEGKLPDAQLLSREGSISIDAIRAIQERLSRTAVEGGHKTVLIPDAERLTPEAANALLKTLEEPPEHCTIILTVSSERSLLPTIVSRCAVLPFRTVPEEELRSALLTRGLQDHTKLALALALAEGRPGRALSFLSEEGMLDAALERARTVGTFPSQSFLERFAFASRMSEDRAETESMLAAWAGLLRLALLTRAGSTLVLPPELSSALQPLLTRTPDQLLSLLKRTLEAREGLRENANVRLSLESLLLAF